MCYTFLGDTMVILSIVLAILFIITSLCGIFVVNTQGYWLIDGADKLSEMQKQEIHNANNLGGLCKYISICMFSLSAYVIAIFCGCYFKIQMLIIASSVVEVLFILISVIYINTAKKHKKHGTIQTDAKPTTASFVPQAKPVSKPTTNSTQPAQTTEAKSFTPQAFKPQPFNSDTKK